MDALIALHTRVSSGLLTDPGPTEKQLEQIFKAAVRAADHGRLRPWRFLIIEGDDRRQLGDLFLKAAVEDGVILDEEARDKIIQKPLRAPLILVAIACVSEDPKVPEIEQVMSAGAAVQNMLTACHALNLGAMWRTGPMAYHPLVRSGLGMTDTEQLVGFLYIGQIRGRAKKAPRLAAKDFIQRWPGS